MGYLGAEAGYGDFELFYVRDREKREVDFLITERHKPFALVEAKLTASDVDPSLRYFTERLKPRYALQIVRTPERFKRAFMTHDILLAPAFVGRIVNPTYTLSDYQSDLHVVGLAIRPTV